MLGARRRERRGLKIPIWIRPDATGTPTLRLDTEWESRDTPVIQRYGKKLADAIEGTAEKEGGME